MIFLTVLTKVVYALVLRITIKMMVDYDSDLPDV